MAEMGTVEVEWGVFSLAIVNCEGPIEELDPEESRGIKALRTAVAVRDRLGNEAMGNYYAAIGNRIFDGLQSAQVDATITGALADAGLPEEICAEAQADPTTWDKLVEEHTRLVSETRSFGVPTIGLDGPGGPVIFGPVISNPPENDADALALWEHTTWLTRYDNFSELKRDRTVDPDLELWRVQHS